jgi:hypothetical protein
MTASLAIERHRTNPFATRHTRPGGVPPLDDDGRPRDLEGLLARLGSMPAAAIVGPHGTGKSTLLAAILTGITAAGRPVRLVRLRRRRDGLAALAIAVRGSRGETLAIDGWERADPVTAAAIRVVARIHGGRLLVTSHFPAGMPTLVQTGASWRLLEAVVARLPDHGGLIGQADLAAAFARHPGNIRDALGELYDRFERRRRGS